jgi:hypothetical protein
LTNPGKLCAQPAGFSGAAPEQVERSVEYRPIVAPSNEDGSACNSHPAPRVETDKGEGSQKSCGLARIHV